MKRRDFITLVGSAAAWPVVARAQQVKMPVIGLMSSGRKQTNLSNLEAFHKGLRTAGKIEGQNLAIEYRWANGNYDEFAEFAAEFVKRRVGLIAVFDNTAAARAAKAATSTIPIVFAIGTDPVKFGLVESLNRPGGNLTGVVNFTVGLGIKRLQVFREMIPNASIIAVLANPNNPAAEDETRDVMVGAREIGQAIDIIKARTEAEIDEAFASAAKKKASGVLIISEPFFSTRYDQIAALAARNALPVIDAYKEFALKGGLMSYGASFEEQHRILGIYAGRIINGEKTGDLPVQRGSKVELVINLKTARTLGLTVPTSLLVRADEVIE